MSKGYPCHSIRAERLIDHPEVRTQGKTLKGWKRTLSTPTGSWFLGGTMWIRKGVKLLEEEVGGGPPVERQHWYVLAIRITLSRGAIVRHPEKCLGHQIDENLRMQEDGYVVHRVRVDRENLVGGIFYTVLGMRVGGYRKVIISPHLAYREAGIPGVIPPNAKLTAEIKILEEK